MKRQRVTFERAKAALMKRTGPSRRTAAQRAAIDKRAAADTRAKRKAARKEARKAKKAAKKPALKSIAAVLAPLVATTAGNKGRNRTPVPNNRSLVLDGAPPHASPGVPAIAIGRIKLGKRHRTDFSHVPGIVKSINARGGLIQPISLRPDFTLIAGESRMKAWELSRFAGQPIPYHVLDVDSILQGEWDENATRKDFTHSEAVSIKRDVEKEFERLRRERERSEKAAPGRKASGKLAGRGADAVAKFTGIGRESLRKAEELVDAAAADPQRFGDLVDQMDKSGKVNAAHKKLKVRAAKAAINAAPPAMPMNAKQCATWVVDFPWAGEMERDQDKLDAAGRAFRPYPEMNVKTCCAFAAEQIAPNLPDDVALWLLVTNFILVRGYHLHVYGALGFKPADASTMVTWGKDKIGRGQILRDQTEHAILLTRGKVTIDVTGANPPATLLLAPRRGNSQKPDELWRLFERVTPAKRFASIFSQGGEGANWDSHGDQVGKYAPAAAPVETEGAKPVDGEMQALERVAAAPGAEQSFSDAARTLLTAGKLVAGKRTLRLTKAGHARLAQLQQEWAEQQQLNILPADLDQLVALYGVELKKRHDLITQGCVAEAGACTRMLDLLVMRANGGDSFGSAVNADPERLRRENAAPIGHEPIWGQYGIWRLDIDGVPYLVKHDDGFEVYAEDPRLPFISETGYRNLGAAGDADAVEGEGAAFGHTVAQQAEAFIRECIATVTDTKTGKAKPRKGAMPLPGRVHRLPATWGESDCPVEMKGAKRSDAPVPHQVDLEEAIAAKAPAEDGLGELERLGLRRSRAEAAA